MNSVLLAVAATVVTASTALAQPSVTSYPLRSTEGLRPNGVAVAASEFEGRTAVEVRLPSDLAWGNRNTLAVVEGTDFQDGIIEVDVASRVNPDAWFFIKWFARGFVGVAFRADADLGRFECVYLRPLNGHAEDPERRKHAVQYVSYPDYDWRRLREEAPGQYEGPADIGPDEWTHVKVVVEGSTARLFLDEGVEPVLTVQDLKLGKSARGAIGLWIDKGTIAHFSDLRVTRGARP